MEVSFEDAWKEIEREFDWAKVHKAMCAVGWEWTAHESTPSIKEMKECAKELLKDVYEGKSISMRTGGFFALKEDTSLILQFVFDAWDVTVAPPTDSP